ncbi:MAG: hypothetical protein FWD16_04950 [Clostridia bacterium]|nr:hypothetical protein [Clostridia bacterium]
MKKLLSYIVLSAILLLALAQPITVAPQAQADPLPRSLSTIEGLYVPPGRELVGAAQYDMDEPADALPDTLNLAANTKWFPPIAGQGPSDCVAYAATYYQFSYQVARLMDWDVRSNIFSTSWTYNFINGGVNNGAVINQAYVHMKNNGVATRADFSTYGSNSTTGYAGWPVKAEVYRRALEWRVLDYAAERYAPYYSPTTENTPITGPDSPALLNMKTLLNEGHPLVFATDINGWYDWDEKNKQPGINTVFVEDYGQVCINTARGKGGTHAMAIVGYDDNLWVDINDDGEIDDFEKGAFLVVNEWGTGWGNNGFIWVAYDTLNIVSADGGETRPPMLLSYQYFTCDVGQVAPKLTVEITLTAIDRSLLAVNMSEYGEEARAPFGQRYAPLINFPRGNFSFFGGPIARKEKVEGGFVMDYGPLLTEGWEDKKWCVIVKENGKEDNPVAGVTVSYVKIMKGEEILLETWPDDWLLGQEKVYYMGMPVVTTPPPETSPPPETPPPTDTPKPTETESTPTPFPFRKGDINCDSRVDIEDILLVRDIIFGQQPTPAQRAALDLLCQGTPDINVLLTVRDIIFGGK